MKVRYPVYERGAKIFWGRYGGGRQRSAVPTWRRGADADGNGFREGVLRQVAGGGFLRSENGDVRFDVHLRAGFIGFLVFLWRITSSYGGHAVFGEVFL